MVGLEPLHRQRKKHTRSRTGCITCRERHVRCDERRPACSNCVTSSRECQYQLWRERSIAQTSKAILPGLQIPWQLCPVLLNTSPHPNPSHALPIDMPDRSRELLQYFTKTEASLTRYTTICAEDNCNSIITTDPVICRSVIVFAGLHFAGLNGGLRSFKTSYLHHKLQCIQDIQRCITDPEEQSTVRCLKLIGTLCISEICLGKLSTAGVQLAALGRIHGMRTLSGTSNDSRKPLFEDQLLQRYTLICHSLFELKKEVEFAMTQTGNPTDEELEQMFLNDKAVLDILRVLPRFISIDPKVRVQLIDVSPIIAILRTITSILTSTLQPSSATSQNISYARELITSMILIATKLHVASLTGIGKAEPEGADVTISSWDPMCAAGILYVIEGPLSLLRASGPTHFSTLVSLFHIVKEDLDSSRWKLETRTYNSDLWLWKAFVALLALKKAQHAYISDHKQFQVTQDMENDAYQLLACWARAQNTLQWETAKTALYRVVWADRFPETEVEMLWREATAEA